MFGEGHAFRAGTISGVKDKTAYGYVLHYCDEYGLNLSEAEKTVLQWVVSARAEPRGSIRAAL